MVRGSETFALIRDHLGSVRFVLNTADNAIAQQLRYDPFGKVILDTNPGFQPFGYAGGLYDPDTTLTRFGARDYDAHTARWTARDPIAFGGGQTNLYVYVGNDPINFVDPNGAIALPAAVLAAPSAAWAAFEFSLLVYDVYDTATTLMDPCASDIDKSISVTGLLSGAILPGGGYGPAAKAVRKCSFTAETPVLICDGSHKAIKEVRQGDLVLAQHKETGEVACREVESRSANPNQAIILVTLESADGTTEVIETTENHPFYVEGRGWTRVDELIPGDLVPSATNGILTVSALEWTDRAEIVYNFGVDEFHTYFVGESGAWVHNCSFKSVDDAISQGLISAGGVTEKILRAVEGRFRTAKPKSWADSMDALTAGTADVNMGTGYLVDVVPGQHSRFVHSGGLESIIEANGSTRVVRRSADAASTVWEYLP